jgi:hypothetical protein
VNTLDFWLTKPSFDMNCIYSYNQVIIFKLNFCVNIYIYIYIYCSFVMNKHQEKIRMLLTSSILPALAILLAATLAIVTNINNDVQQAFAQDLT